MAQMEGGFNLLGKSKSVCMMVDGLEVQKAKKERKLGLREIVERLQGLLRGELARMIGTLGA